MHMDIIKKDMKMAEIVHILTEHSINMPFGWEIVLNMLLSECDHLEVHDFGQNAYFTQVME